MPDRVEEVAVRIAGVQWHAWSSVQIHRGLDSFSTVAFESPFEPERQAFRDTFQPFSFKDLEVLVGGEPLFTGTLVGVAPSLDPKNRVVQCSGYSKPAVFEDSTPPASAWPLELNGLRLRAIAETLVGPFGVSVEMSADEGAAFRRVAIRPDEKVLPFLADLARQRGLIVSDTPAGALRFLQSAEGEPVVSLVEGEAPLVGVSARFSPQSYYSEITGQARARAGHAGGGHTIENPFLTSIVRPLTFTLEETDGGDVEAATAARLGRMFGNALEVSVDVPTWRDPAGALWTPGDTVTLEAPGAMIYNATNFLIRRVTLTQNADALSAALHLALPGAFSGDLPSSLPWGP